MRDKIAGWEQLTYEQKLAHIVFSSVSDDTLNGYWRSMIEHTSDPLVSATSLHRFIVDEHSNLVGSTLRGYKAAAGLFREASGIPFTVDENASLDKLIKRCVAADIVKTPGGVPVRGSINNETAQFLIRTAATVNPVWGNVIALFNTLGLRSFQLEALTPQDVDLTLGTITVLRKATQLQKAKKGDWETLPIATKEGYNLLKRLMQTKVGDVSPFVVWNHSQLNDFISRTLQQHLKVDKSVVFDGVHCLRHGTAVSIAWSVGVEAARVAQGWHTTVSAQGYTALGRSGTLDPELKRARTESAASN